jgi:hypothetical protein
MGGFQSPESADQLQVSQGGQFARVAVLEDIAGNGHRTGSRAGFGLVGYAYNVYYVKYWMDIAKPQQQTASLVW